MSDLGTNTGHGHVWKRPDGVRMRCGGPGMCDECSRDAARLKPMSDPTTAETPTKTPKQELEYLLGYVSSYLQGHSGGDAGLEFSRVKALGMIDDFATRLENYEILNEPKD